MLQNNDFVPQKCYKCGAAVEQRYLLLPSVFNWVTEKSLLWTTKEFFVCVQCFIAWAWNKSLVAYHLYGNWTFSLKRLKQNQRVTHNFILNWMMTSRRNKKKICFHRIWSGYTKQKIICELVLTLILTRWYWYFLLRRSFIYVIPFHKFLLLLLKLLLAKIWKIPEKKVHAKINFP